MTPVYGHMFKEYYFEILNEIIKKCSTNDLSHIATLIPDSIKEDKVLLEDKNWKKILDELERLRPIN